MPTVIKHALLAAAVSLALAPAPVSAAVPIDTWGKAGVSLPHSSGAQYASLPHVGRAQLRAGDLVFFGSPIHHVGIYEGGGVMINAPETGENVRRDSIARADYAGAARP